jgi:hypothetical protein
MGKRHLFATAWLTGALVGGLGIGFGAGLSGCESGFDRNDQIVNSLRILGARDTVMSSDGIDWADAEGGDTIQLSALVANPKGLPSVTVTWLACLPVGAISPCEDEGVLRDPTTLIPMANDPSTGVVLLGVGESVQYTVPSEVETTFLEPLLDRARQNVNAECAIYLEVPLIIIAQGGDEVFTATKNLRLAPWSQTGPSASEPALQYYYRNANPSIDQLVIPTDLGACAGQVLTTVCGTNADCGDPTQSCTNGWCVPQAPFPDGNQIVCGHVLPEVAQTYWSCGLTGPLYNVDEKPEIIWYMTAGGLGDVGSSRGTPGGDDLSSRTFTAFSRAPGPFTLYGVIRDGRDG